jgi:hypothetical protein
VAGLTKKFQPFFSKTVGWLCSKINSVNRSESYYRTDEAKEHAKAVVHGGRFVNSNNARNEAAQDGKTDNGFGRRNMCEAGFLLHSE